MVEYEDNIEELLIALNGYEIQAIAIPDDGIITKVQNVNYEEPDKYKIDIFVINDSKNRMGRLEILIRENRAPLFHLFVNQRHRRKGIGTLLVNIYRKYVDKVNIEKVSGRVGNGGTKEFLIENGWPPDSIAVRRIEEAPVEESVAFGWGNADIEVGPGDAVQQYDGMSVDKLE